MSSGKIAASVVLALLVAGVVIWSLRPAEISDLTVENSAVVRVGVDETKSAQPLVRPGPTGTPAPTKRPELTAEQLARRAARQAERRKEKEITAEANRLARARVDATRRLTPLFQQRSLTAEQQEKLITLVTNQYEAGVDLAAAYAKQGVDVTLDRATYWAANEKLKQEFQAEVKALLGDEGYMAYLANDLVVRQSAVIEHLQTRLTPDGAQLTDAQSAQLLSLLKGQNSFRVDDDILQGASRFLSPAQMEMLQLEHVRQTEGALKPAVQKAISKNFDPNAGLPKK